ncbi:hypothetical protein IGJ55_001710 [Enterococcus sp. AZ170]|uniref:cell division site-positioning protein MapZ family protein n=1 Tax=Enterococcus sp. AZ170 TaxID=2774747 RepID=UPI003D2FDF2C
MTKQCPNCGTEIDNQAETCSECGYSFNEEQTQQKQDKKAETSSFLNKEQNENIEWSELKDMSIGHVMTMFNEEKTEEKATEGIAETKTETPEENTRQNTKESSSTKEETSPVISKKEELENTAALNQYINEHKNEQSDSPVRTNKESNNELASDQLVKIDEPSESNHTGQDEVKSNELENETNGSTNEKSEQIRKDRPKDEITKFTKPAETGVTTPIGPKALPNKQAEIPSKSKKPEEIEMDAAPIFFKEPEVSNTIKDQFEKQTETNKTQEESKNKAVTTAVTNNYKKLSIVLAAAVVLAGGSWFAYNQMQNKSADQGQVTQNKDKLVIQTEKELNSYFTDDKQLFLKPEMVSVSTKTIKENLDTLKETSNYKALEETYNKVIDKQAAITKVNELFTQPIIDGSKLKDATIKADKKIDLAKREEQDAFDTLLNQATDQAVSQYDQLQKAKAAVDVFYKDNGLTEALTRENYTTAKNEVDQVKNVELRKPLNDVLVKADKLLADAEAASIPTQQVVPEQTPAVSDNLENNTQTTAGVQPDSDTFSAPNAQGVYTAPVYSVDANDVSDLSNPAWSWAPGVQEKVIATCIERGYITAGAYSLQPARIINGEGYYNLYGADNQYLVTINAKTGWFKGNASRNAGR